MTDHRYPHVARFISETPWAILPSKLAAILELAEFRLNGGTFTPEEIEARIGAQAQTRQVATTGTVAVIPMMGVLVPRANLMSDMSGGTSTSQFGAAFQAAIDDPAIGGVLLQVDSPGGSASLIPEVAAQIRDARGSKQIVAIADTMAASAAYWLASAADEFVVTPSGMVGSIGVLTSHDDISAAMEQEGVKTTLISAGKFKTEGNPYEPLGDEARAELQRMVDEYYAMFVGAVAEGRGVPVAAVKDGFGQGRMLTAKRALQAGMVDRVDTFEATVERMVGDAMSAAPVQIAPAARTRALASGGIISSATLINITPGTIIESAPVATDSFVSEAYAVRDAADALADRTISLAEVKRRRLTAAKRDALVAASGALHASADMLATIAAEHDPAANRAALRAAEFDLIRREHLTPVTGD